MGRRMGTGERPVEGIHLSPMGLHGSRRYVHRKCKHRRTPESRNLSVWNVGTLPCRQVRGMVRRPQVLCIRNSHRRNEVCFPGNRLSSLERRPGHTDDAPSLWHSRVDRRRQGDAGIRPSWHMEPRSYR